MLRFRRLNPETCKLKRRNARISHRRIPSCGRALLSGRSNARSICLKQRTPSSARHLERPDRLRQDSFCRAHGVAPGTPLITVACHEDLSATDLVGVSCSKAKKQSGMTARLHRGAQRRYLLSRRSGRSAQRHGRDHSSAHGSSAAFAD